jgi:heme/copper-type cytochrome/quinol oxidase subunit 3
MASSPMLALPSGERARPRNLTTVGVLVAVVGSLMGFLALLAAYVNVSHFNKPWPPRGVRIQNYPGTMLTLTMLMALVTMEWAVYATRREQRGQSVSALLLTIGLGLAFLNLLWYFGRRIGFGPGESAFAVMFFALLVAAGSVAAIGVALLIGAFGRVLGRQYNGVDVDGLRATAWFWDFAVVAWVIVYATLWLTS